MDFKSHSGDYEIKASSRDGVLATVAGYFSKFNNVDLDGDVIVPGAFAKTLAERGPGGTNQIMHLLQHDSWQVLGKPELLKEDNFGLYFETPIADTVIGRDTVTLYKLGVYNEHSIGFRIIGKTEDEMTDEQGFRRPVRKLTELKLWEGSTVTWWANPMTPVVGIKSTDRKSQLDEIAERLIRLEKAITDNHFSEKTMNLLQIEIGVLANAVKQIESEPVEDTTLRSGFDPTAFQKAYDIGLNINNFFKL